MSESLVPKVRNRPRSRVRRISPLPPKLRIPVKELDTEHQQGRSQRIESLASSFELLIPNNVQYNFSKEHPVTLNIAGYNMMLSLIDFKVISVLGSGTFGSVELVELKGCSAMRIAVKRISFSLTVEEKKAIEMDIEVIKSCGHHVNIVEFYGAFIFEGEIWICMELMDISMDNFYKVYFEESKEGLPEYLLTKLITEIVDALEYLRSNDIIHRDVKPSNMLTNLSSTFKLCDFGISGKLVDSVANTLNKGCRAYFAPERIEPVDSYDIRSDIWSLGISIIEMANAKHPFSGTIFQLLKQIQSEHTPKLPAERFSSSMQDFVAKCLTKDVKSRPDYAKLMRHDLISYRKQNPIQSLVLIETVKKVIEIHHKRLGIVVHSTIYDF